MATTQAPISQQNEWIERREAADRLNVSERSVLLYAQEGKIKTKRERNASNQIATMFHTGDVERFGLERANLEVVQGYGRAKKLPDSRVELVEQTEQTAVQALPALQPLGSWMTLDEAVTVSQLIACLAARRSRGGDRERARHGQGRAWWPLALPEA